MRWGSQSACIPPRFYVEDVRGFPFTTGGKGLGPSLTCVSAPSSRNGFGTIVVVYRYVIKF